MYNLKMRSHALDCFPLTYVSVGGSVINKSRYYVLLRFNTYLFLFSEGPNPFSKGVTSAEATTPKSGE